MPEQQRDREKPATHDTDAHGARAIVASLQSGEPTSTEIFDAFWRLDRLPADDVREALTAWLGPLPDVDRLDPATRRAHGLPPPPLRLRTVALAKDADVLDLGPVAEQQIRVAGKSWDDVDLAPEERLDGELDGSFAGTLERRVLADANAPGAPPLFDVLLFAGDSGVVFAAGTAEVVALIAYGKVEMRDRHARVAIEEALSAADLVHAHAHAPAPIAAAPRPSAAASSVREEKAETETQVARVASPSAQRAAEPEAVALPRQLTLTGVTATNEAVVKKAASSKVTTKKAAANKAPVKKAAANKAPLKKAPVKKGAAKTAAVKKSAAKKAPQKKVPAKSAPAKKSAAKKGAPRPAANRGRTSKAAPARTQKPAAKVTKKAAAKATRGAPKAGRRPR